LGLTAFLQFEPSDVVPLACRSGL